MECPLGISLQNGEDSRSFPLNDHFTKMTLKQIVEETTAMTLDFTPSQYTDSFSNVHQYIQQIYKENAILYMRLRRWKHNYDELTLKNAKKHYLFCLDSFFFQYKIFLFEMDHFKKYMAFLNHRIYGDYYHLYSNMMEKYHVIDQDLSMNPSVTHSKPKELEPFFEYSLTEIANIHRGIVDTMVEMYRRFLKKQDTILLYTTKSDIGYSIFPFLNTLKYENLVVREQILLYQNHLSFFYETHSSFLQHLLVKMKEFKNRLNSHFQVLRIDDSEEDSSEEEEEDIIVNAGGISFQYDKSFSDQFFDFSEPPGAWIHSDISFSQVVNL